MQRFKGLNAWDQLAVEIEVNGNLPSVSPSSSITFSDTTDAYAFQGENKIQSDGSGTITIDDQNFTFIINQAVFRHSLLGDFFFINIIVKSSDFFFIRLNSKVHQIQMNDLTHMTHHQFIIKFQK